MASALGFMSFFTKACAQALLEFPEVNSQLHEDELVYFNYADISIAVSTDRGLVVPVVRNAHLLSLAEIERVIADLAGRARQNKISIEEMQGGTFTITNGGVFGSLLSTPILNPPRDSYPLGMHKIQERPMAIGGQVQGASDDVCGALLRSPGHRRKRSRELSRSAGSCWKTLSAC